jgi:hypothetical protein
MRIKEAQKHADPADPEQKTTYTDSVLTYIHL